MFSAAPRHLTALPLTPAHGPFSELKTHYSDASDVHHLGPGHFTPLSFFLCFFRLFVLHIAET